MFAILIIAEAVSSTSLNPSFLPTSFIILFRTVSIDTGLSTESSDSGFKRPRTRFASVIVGLVPPRP